MTSREGFGSDGGDASRENEAGDFGAASECTCSDGGDGFRNDERGELATSVEGIVGNRGEGCEVTQLAEGSDCRLVLEYGTKGGDGSCLAIAEFAIGVGVPILYAELLDERVGEWDRHVLEVVGLESYDCFHTLAVATFRTSNTLLAWIESRKEEETVALSSPSPVDVVESVSVVAIAYESMSYFVVGSRDVEWATVGKLVVAELVP